VPSRRASASARGGELQQRPAGPEKKKRNRLVNSGLRFKIFSIAVAAKTGNCNSAL
jgi:hypothetical protein